MDDKYRDALIQAQTELAILEERRAILLKLIGDLKSLSQDELYELTPPPGYEPEGLTAEVRKILGLTTVHLTPVQIRDSLMQRGFSKANPKNLLIAVHTVLGRIEKELDAIERDGKSVYKAKVSSSYAPTLADMVRLAAEYKPDKVMLEMLKAIGLTPSEGPIVPTSGPEIKNKK
jgi:hypothetical protein